MDAATKYNVVFNGAIRDGFERKTVARALAQKLKLNSEQVKRLFDGTDHTLKRTTTEGEANRVVMWLAQIGATARVVSPVDSATVAAKPVSRKRTSKTLSPFLPLKSMALFRPLLYLAVLAEAAYAALYVVLLAAICYFGFFTLWASPASNSPLLILGLQIAGAPLLVVLLLLLAKPLLSLRHLPYRGVYIPEDQEPDLYVFVQDVCERMGVRAPEEIRLNNDVAITVYHHGLFGFWRNRYVLTIGVPLLASLKTNQLAALLGHEILCFRSALSPRASFLLMACDRWLHTALHREDSFDLALKRWQEEGRISPAMVKGLQRLFAFSRRLMLPRRAMSRIFERRLVHTVVAMADEEACILTGRNGLGQALEQQRLLTHTMEELRPLLQNRWEKKGVLPDNLIQLTLFRSRQYPTSIHAELREAHERKKADEHDLIPAYTQRIKRLETVNVAPAYACASPAHSMLRYFTKLTTTLTLRYYHNRLNLPATPNKLIHQPHKGSLEEQLHNKLNAYFNGLLYLMLPLNLRGLADKISDKETARKEWRIAMQHIRADQEQAKRDFSLNANMEKLIGDNKMHEGLYRAGLWDKLGEAKPKKDEMEAFLLQCREVEIEHELSMQKVKAHQRFYAQRLATVIALLQPAEEQMDTDIRYQEIEMLLTVYSRIESALPKVRELKMNVSLLNTLLSYLNSDRPSTLRDRIDELSFTIRRSITAIKMALKDVPTPFTAPRDGKNLVDYLLLQSYSEMTPEGDFDRGNDIVNRLALVQQRILVRLIDITREGEQSITRVSAA